MSIESSREEFYPVAVEELNVYTMDDINLVEHSLKKWEGALKKNLKKHNVSYGDHCLLDEEHKHFFFYADSCSLCEKYFEYSEDCYDYDNKKYCPLYVTLGESCSGDGKLWCKVHDDVRPMVVKLRKTLNRLKNQ